MLYYFVLERFKGVDIYIVMLMKQSSTGRHVTNFNTNILISDYVRNKIKRTEERKANGYRCFLLNIYMEAIHYGKSLRQISITYKCIVPEVS